VLRFLSPEWVAAFSDAFDGVALPEPGEDAGLGAASGHFTVAQRVHGGPDGTVTVVLEVGGGTLGMHLGSDHDADPDVTISLSYDDAAALSRGDLATADALGEGRIRVRGDLSVLVECQRVLADARSHLADLSATTTY
jgi:hypothetical protein